MATNGYFLDHIWMIPLFPAAGALLMFLFGRKLKNAVVSTICVGSVAAAFIYAAGAVWSLLQMLPESRFVQVILFDWVPAGSMHMTNGSLARFDVPWGLMLDPLNSVMVLVVTGVGMLIHIYSVGYMGHEGGYYRFFGYLNLFMFSMLTLILANNMLLMFVGWEGVGLCSYLLIGFYFLKKSASDAGKKAFIVNRIGDAGFLLGLFLILGTLGTINFHEIGPAIAAGHFPIGAPVMTAIALLLFVGATGKSAQIPLYVWLPDAMEGPTPVSALIHAATMVTAGVYMVTRLNAIFQLSPTAMDVVAITGAATAIFAASMALVQNDIKRVLAYSTISQLGYMFLGLGVGAFTAGVFHLMTHAFFKALLFLGSGSVIHAMSGEQDMRKMGALWHKIPTTARTFLVGTIAIAGIPPLAGFFSKDAILGSAYERSPILWVVGWVTAGMTAFYMFRLVNMTFFGKSRVEHDVEHHIHESPLVMTAPLLILAVFSIIGGWIGWPESIWGSDHFAHFLDPVIAHYGVEGASVAEKASRGALTMDYLLMLASVLIAVTGIGLAYRWYIKETDRPERFAARFSGAHKLLSHKYYIDEIYDALFVNRTKDLGLALGSFDRGVIDGAGVNGVGLFTRVISRISMWWDKWIVDGLVNLSARFVGVLSYPTRILQTGKVSGYALMIVAGLIALLGYYLHLVRLPVH
jgi:NADH-quinone oxidoreductase subunit L